MTLQTGASEVVEVANQTIHPFTDLLLHDMGRDLSDGRAEFAVSGREWRTSPLWGIGMHEELSDARPGFLHDGRARTLSEAILWHGGEAARSRNAFKRLSKVEREQLLKFFGPCSRLQYNAAVSSSRVGRSLASKLSLAESSFSICSSFRSDLKPISSSTFEPLRTTNRAVPV